MLNVIPVVGWLLSFLLSVFISVPFYFIWNALGPIYFYWLPKVYLNLPFWHCVGLFMLMPMVKTLLLPSFKTTLDAGGKK